MVGVYPFRFDALNHEYIDLATGETLPHITGMLERTGWIDDTWFTEESSVRGQAVHRLTADYDLGALDVQSCVSLYRGWLLAYVKAMKLFGAEILAVEEPAVHPMHKFGGRPDRVLRVLRALGVLEIKSGLPAKSHPIQTALQAILVAPQLSLPPESLLRFALYVRDNGSCKLEEHKRRYDFDKAREIIKTCCSAC